jgi:two-component system response regulator PilR (NtrC family)
MYPEQPDAFRRALHGTEGTKGVLEKDWSGTLILDDVNFSTTQVQLDIKELLDEDLSCRLIFTAGTDLLELVTNGMFADDLYYRINPFEIVVPPLRSRRNEIPRLAQVILGEITNLYKGSGSKSLQADAVAKLQAHDYPRNISELQNVLLRAYVLCADNDIGPQHISF